MVLECLHYNYNTTDTCTDSYDKCAKPVACPAYQSDLQYHCFVVWQTDPSNPEPKILSAGCNPPYNSTPSDNCDKECIGQPKGQRYYCCCTTDLCNKYFKTPPPKPPKAPPSPFEGAHADVTRQAESNPILWYMIAICITLMLVLSFLIYIHKYRARKRKEHLRNGILDEVCAGALAIGGGGHNGVGGNPREFNELINYQETEAMMSRYNQQQQHQQQNLHHHHHHNHHHHHQQHLLQQQQHYDSNNDIRLDLNSIKLLEVVGSGRFGTVHRATSNEFSEIIAVKIANEQPSWQNEKEIYSLPELKHPNVLGYLGSCENIANSNFWLVVEYAELGSLYSYLKENIINFKQFLQVSLGITRGLSHLHDVDIAHRDFKSKNVLMKKNLVPCITDFGVAAILDTSAGCKLDHRKKYLQVGTPRYMAPEVLECSVTFTKSSFTKIDVYALSLVLWELLSRCHERPPLTVPSQFENHADQQQQQQPNSEDYPPYRLPFEDIAGSNPDINSMRQIVVVEKLRPPFRDEWRACPDICRAIEDGWEYDHDARISASCFVERVEGLLGAAHMNGAHL